jgi:3-oxoadipate enol-lactonase
MSHLHVLRSGEGPTLLLLHGIGSSATAWSKQVERLGRYYTCIAPDLPGYGHSPDPAGADLQSLVEEVASVLDGQPAHVLGVSFGALTALGLASFRPDLVRTLILADATLGRATLGVVEREAWLRHRETLAHELATRSVERAAEIASPQACAEVIEEIALHMRRARPAGYMAVARAIAATDARAWLCRIEQPALILCGEDDQVTGADVSRTLSENLVNAVLLTIPGAGHAPHIEQPDRFAAAVRAFLDRAS